MTFLEKLADLISGGALTRARSDLRRWQAESNHGWTIAILRAHALQHIAAMETPSANATVKRMAKTAREALE